MKRTAAAEKAHGKAMNRINLRYTYVLHLRNSVVLLTLQNRGSTPHLSHCTANVLLSLVAFAHLH